MMAKSWYGSYHLVFKHNILPALSILQPALGGVDR